MSYLVGSGSSYPVQVHHRGASIESITLLPSKVGCIDGLEKWYTLNESNPNVLFSALVGGPDRKDGFSDQHGNYEQTEPSIAGNAPLAGLFGKLKSVFGNSGTYILAFHATRFMSILNFGGKVPEQTSPFKAEI